MGNQEIAWLLKEKYNGIKTEAFEADCVRLVAGEPLGYLIGHVPFLNCSIYLDSHPLIPRVETEYWVEKAITTISQRKTLREGSSFEDIHGTDQDVTILDLCAGSGAIGVAVAKAIPTAHVTFVEIDETHPPTIQKNLTTNIREYPNRLGYYSVTPSDLFANITGQFDFILTNPPYIDAAAHTVDTDVAKYEPHLALFGGDAGMEIIARIIADAHTYLTPNGQLWIEHEPAQVDVITTLAHANGFTSVTHPDQYDTPRYSILTMAQ